MNDIEVFCSQQTHPNNVLLHVLASFAGKMPSGIICCLLQIRSQDANEREFFCRQQTHPNNVLLFICCLLQMVGENHIEIDLI